MKRETFQTWNWRSPQRLFVLSVFNKWSSLRKVLQHECWIFAGITSMYLRIIKGLINKVISVLWHPPRKSLSCRDCLPGAPAALQEFLLAAFDDDTAHQQESPGLEICACQPAAGDKAQAGWKSEEGKDFWAQAQPASTSPTPASSFHRKPRNLGKHRGHFSLSQTLRAQQGCESELCPQQDKEQKSCRGWGCTAPLPRALEGLHPLVHISGQKYFLSLPANSHQHPCSTPSSYSKAEISCQIKYFLRLPICRFPSVDQCSNCVEVCLGFSTNRAEDEVRDFLGTHSSPAKPSSRLNTSATSERQRREKIRKQDSVSERDA